jgi:ABC-2 type transport system ATP-binding protein
MQIKIKNLSKDFKKVRVVNNVTITFDSGNIYGIVGRNGSGKSVFLKMICAFYIPSEGTICQDDYNYIENNSFPKNTRALIDGPNFISNISGYENLKLLASIENKISNKDILETMRIVGLYDVRNKKYGEYSLGMKQKLGIAQVLMEKPDCIILDEPFNGIDRESVKKIKKILLEEKNKGKLIIITSHIKDDIESLANYIFEFDCGVLKKYDKKNKL